MSHPIIDEVLSKLNFLIEKSTAMQTSIDNFNKRSSEIENKITNLESEVEEIKATKADYDMLNDLEAKTNAALDALKNRCDDMQEFIQNAKAHLCNSELQHVEGKSGLFAQCWPHEQRWSPRGHILQSLALASKVKSWALASKA